MALAVGAASASAADQTTPARRVTSAADVTVQPAVKHSAPYTRLLGTAGLKAPVHFADGTATKKTAAQTVGFHHRAYYAGYGPYYGPYPYPYGARYAAPYVVGYPYGAWNYYTPYAYSYTPWIGGWSGYPYYTGYTPGFGGYYSVGYRPGGYGYYGNYGGCCYW